MWNFPLFPDQASTMAEQVDALYFFELGIAGFFTCLICMLILTFAARYRQKAESSIVSNPPLASKLMEVLWIGVPLVPGHGDVRLGGDPLFPDLRAARRCARGRRGRQAVDVAPAACRRPLRDQRAARSARAGRSS